MVRLTRREAQSTGLVQPRVLRRTLPDVHLVAAPGNTWFGEGQGSYSWSTTSSTLVLRIFAGASDGIPSTIASIARAASSVSKMATLRPSVPSADRPHVALTRPGAFLTCGAPPRSQASLPPLPFDWRRSRLLRTMHALAPPLTRRSPECYNESAERLGGSPAAAGFSLITSQATPPPSGAPRVMRRQRISSMLSPIGRANGAPARPRRTARPPRPSSTWPTRPPL